MVYDFEFSVWLVGKDGKDTKVQTCKDEFDAMQVRFLMKKEHPENIYEIRAREVA